VVFLIGVYGDNKTRWHRQTEFGHDNKISPLVAKKTRLLRGFLERIDTAQERGFSSAFLMYKI
jgi:hypothetical protein